MIDQEKELKLFINDRAETDENELADLTQQLRQELLDIDVKAVDLDRKGKAPERAKAGDPVTWGTLLVTLAASGGILPVLISVIQSWVERHKSCSVTLKMGDDMLEVKGISSKKRQQLIDAWLERQINR